MKTKRFHRFKLDFCVQGTGTIFNEEALEEIAEDQGVETQEVKKQFSSPIGKILQILILLTPALISPARPMLTDYAQRTPLYVQIDNLDENNVKMFYKPNYELKRKTFLIPVDESEFTGSPIHRHTSASSSTQHAPGEITYRGWFRPFVSNEYSVFLLAGRDVHAELAIGHDASDGRIRFSRARKGSDIGDLMKISPDDELELRRSEPVKIQCGKEGGDGGKSIPFSVTVFADSVNDDS